MWGFSINIFVKAAKQGVKKKKNRADTSSEDKKECVVRIKNVAIEDKNGYTVSLTRYIPIFVCR